MIALAVTVFAVAAVALGLVLFLWYYLSENMFNPQGKGADEKVARIFRRHGLLRGCKVLTSGALARREGAEIPLGNLLIGPFGILMVHTCGARGEYYGTLDGEKWVLVQNEQRTSFSNPLQQQQKAIQELRALFAANEVYKVPIENMVVLTNKSSKTGLFITNSGEIMMIGKLKGYLQKGKFEKDSGVDVEKVYQLIAENRK